MVFKVAFIYLASIAWGCLALLPVVKLQEVGQGFYRFFGFACVALQTLAIGLAILMWPVLAPSYRLAAWILGFSLFFTLCFTTALRLRIRALLWTSFLLAVLSGSTVFTYFPWVGQYALLWKSLHALSSALLMGSVILAMMLGHWYLVTPKLSITPLKRYSALYILLTAWMALLIVSCFIICIHGHGDIAANPFTYRIEQEAIFILFRVCWGLLVPLGLAYWIWETVKMKSTQSATGILYAAVVCTIMGEAMGLYLTLITGVPL